MAKDPFETVSGQGALDAAPSGGVAKYLKLPTGFKLFTPDIGKIFKLVFIPWLAGLHNRTGAPGTPVTNRFIPCHRNIGPADEHHLCTYQAFGRNCAGCELFAAMRAQQMDWDTVVRPLKFKDREIFLVHNVEIPKSLYIWDESIHLFGDGFRAKYKRKPEWIAFAHPEKGCIVEIEAKEKKIGKNSCTDCHENIEITVRGNDGLAPWIREMGLRYCPDKYVVETPYAEFKKACLLMGGGKTQAEPPPDEPPADELPPADDLPPPDEEQIEYLPEEAPSENGQEPVADEEPMPPADEEPEPEPEPEPAPAPPPRRAAPATAKTPAKQPAAKTPQRPPARK